MAKRFRKICPSCQQLFLGRRDAKTCGERCRKRLQRARGYEGLGGGELPARPAADVFGGDYSRQKLAASRRQAKEGGGL